MLDAPADENADPALHRASAVRSGQPPKHALADWLRAHADLIVLAVWAIAVGFLAGARQEFGGDGLRHLEQIVSSNQPTPGEPRWWLFPPLLFAIERPLVIAGLVHN